VRHGTAAAPGEKPATYPTRRHPCRAQHPPCHRHPPTARRRLRPQRRPARARGCAPRISAARTALIVLLIFIIQNTRAVQISFLGAHASLSLAVALLLAAIAGALLMAAAGTARITQLRMGMRRDRRRGRPPPRQRHYQEDYEPQRHPTALCLSLPASPRRLAGDAAR
jgi:lipopolysaccharide assembly protein A